jgi:hypothetical protein
MIMPMLLSCVLDDGSVSMLIPNILFIK